MILRLFLIVFCCVVLIPVQAAKPKKRLSKKALSKKPFVIKKGNIKT